MSLTSFIQEPNVRELLVRFRPKFKRLIREDPVVASKSGKPSIVGTAFDYLLRIEIQRRYKLGSATSWVADMAASLPRIEKKDGSTQYIDFMKGEVVDHLHPLQVYEQTTGILQDARAAHREYLNSEEPAKELSDQMAYYSVLLAKMDLASRTGRLYPDFWIAEYDIVIELLELLDIVPWPEFELGNDIRLNPTFEKASSMVGGADADLLSENRLVDIKTKSKNEFSSTDLDQLLGYYFLILKANERNNVLPVPQKAGIYLSRFGVLREIDTQHWRDHQDFSLVYDEFFSLAEITDVSDLGIRHP